MGHMMSPIASTHNLLCKKGMALGKPTCPLFEFKGKHSRVELT